MQKLTALFLTFTLLTLTAPTVFAKQKSDWNTVKSLVNQEIAVKTKNGNTRYGILRAADDSEIKIQLAGKNTVSGGEVVVRREEIEKIWRASLRFRGNNAVKGTLAGLGVGAGIGFIMGASAKEPDPLNYAGVIILGIAGAGIGAIAGAFSKKGHRKTELLYST